VKFFVIGNGAVKAGLDLNYLTPVDAQAANFAGNGQTLQQSLSIAEGVFQLVGRGEINFVLIGLTCDVLFRDAADNLTPDAFDDNLQALSDCIALCHANDALPIAVIMPVKPSARERYDEAFMTPLTDILTELQKSLGFAVVNLFNLKISKTAFRNETVLNDGGAIIASVTSVLRLFNAKIFSPEDFCRLPYDYFYKLSFLTDKDFFNDLMAQIFSITVEKLRRKKKIKVAFVTDHAAVWCGDKLYNLFAENPRFETTIFVCRGEESDLEDTRRDVEQFEAAGLNVVGVYDLQEETPPQDVVFFLRPYHYNFSKSFQFNALTPQTLLCYIPYATGTVLVNWNFNFPIFRLAWKIFFDTEIARDVLDKGCTVGVPRSLVSGVPKLDSLLEDADKFAFPWKMTRPDAVKIIWAPHWSFEYDTPPENHATFPWNCRFMYEFAKAHPETSWVVKPHPRLQTAAVNSGLFSSAEAFEEYLQAWNDLPNAQVYTGGYYQAIFATSDGMIHDSCSFIAEYQFTHKPMIFLFNDPAERFTELGEKILEVTYIVDGKNHKQISDAVQKIFIEGNDPLFGERLRVFDALLNWRKRNGISASGFIYNAVAKELQII